MKTRFYKNTAYLSDLNENEQCDTALFFIHGAGLTKELWKKQVGAFPDQAATIAIDLPGHGESSGSPSKSISEYADAVMAIVRHLAPDRAVLCGLSMGGAVCIDLLIRYPKAFAGAILMHTGARLKVSRLIFDALEKGIEDYIDLMAAFAVSAKSDADKIRNSIRDCCVFSAKTAEMDFMACDAFDRMGSLSAIQVPVLVITGSDDLVTPGKYGTYLHENIKNSYRYVVKDAGHLSPLESPEIINEQIGLFLKKISGQAG